MNTAGFLKTSSTAGFNLGKWIWKNKYLILIIFSLIPVFLTAIQISKDTSNWSYIPVSIGVSVINADSVLYDDVQILRTDPEKIIGMEKPTEGFFQKIKYNIKLGRLSWTLLGLISLITLPFVVFRYFYLRGDNSKKLGATLKALLTFLIFIFVTNLIIMVVNMASGNMIYHLDSSLNFFGQAKQVIKLVLPFHGFVDLFKFLFGMV